MKIGRVLKIIQEALPAETAMENDKIGLQAQAERNEINSILIAYEANQEVIQEAIENNSDCIITFHPLIFSPLYSITNDDRVGDLCSKLIKNSIALISLHTTFDAYSKGTSYIFAKELGFGIVDFLKADETYENRGMGVIAQPEKPISERELLERVSWTSRSPLRYSELKNKKPIDKVAIMAGSGTSFLPEALNSGAQAFITADVKYHQFHSVYGKIMIIDPGHYEMEQFVPFGIAETLKDKLDKEADISIKVSKVSTNPVRYYPNEEDYKTKQEQLLIKKERVISNE